MEGTLLQCIIHLLALVVCLILLTICLEELIVLFAKVFLVDLKCCISLAVVRQLYIGHCCYTRKLVPKSKDLGIGIIDDLVHLCVEDSILVGQVFGEILLVDAAVSVNIWRFDRSTDESHTS